MARYTLPDGRVLDIDLEQLSSEDKVNLQNWLAETYPDNFDRYIEKDIQGYFWNIELSHITTENLRKAMRVSFM